MRNKDVAEGWNKGVVPIFPNYHGNQFFEQKKTKKGGSDDRGSKYRNIMGPVNPMPTADQVPEGMRRPQSPILLPEDPRDGTIEHGARTENGSNVNVVASGYSGGRKAGHTSSVKRCSTRDGEKESCVVESDEGRDNTWKVRSEWHHDEG